MSNTRDDHVKVQVELDIAEASRQAAKKYLRMLSKRSFVSAASMSNAISDYNRWDHRVERLEEILDLMTVEAVCAVMAFLIID